MESGTIYEQTTICARATAPGQGAVAIVRVSGPEAVEVLDKVFRPFNDKGPRAAEFRPREMHYGRIIFPESPGHSTDNAETVIDEVMAVIFRAPHSYTGEDSAEIYCHGSQYIVSEILRALLAAGAVMAAAGEFTKRAFLNGRMDLAQAEAVADLIASENRAAHDIALKQMRGGYSSELQEMRSQMVDIVSLMELELDFSEEDVEFADRSQVLALLDRVSEHISRLVDSFALGNAIKNGIPTAIVGAVNTGKSTLLNALLGEERAIVSDIAGTTRDTIEDTVNIAGTTFRFIDTAGIRETHDTIEALGIERSFRAIERADIVLWVIDQTEAEKQVASLSDKVIPLCKGKQLILVLNKSDLNASSTSIGFLGFPEGTQIISLSAKCKEGIDQLQSLLIEAAHLPALSSSDIIVTNVRHYEALSRALEAIHRVQEGLAIGLSGDFISQDLRECIFHLSDIVGEVTTDEVLGNIFKHFCIGK